jgi:hypothetical protein
MQHILDSMQRTAAPTVQQGPTVKPWFVALKQHIMETTAAAAAEIWSPLKDGQAPFYNYRLEHILQVERDMHALCDVERGDREALSAAVWAHDRFQPQFDGENHAARAAEWAMDYLKFIRFPEEKIHVVCQAVKMHNWKPLEIPESCREARLLWDADHVARLGPADIVSYLLCHSSADFLSSLPENESFPSGAITVQDFAPLLEERRPQAYLADSFYFEVTRGMARDRIAAARAFLDCLDVQTASSAREAATYAY